MSICTRQFYKKYLKFKDIFIISLYFPCLAGNKNSNSRLFVACLKAIFLALSSLWELAFSPLSPRFKFIKKCYFQPLFYRFEFQKNCHFLPLYYRFGKTKKLALFAALLPLWKEKSAIFCLFSACFKISIVLGKLKAPYKFKTRLVRVFKFIGVSSGINCFMPRPDSKSAAMQGKNREGGSGRNFHQEIYAGRTLVDSVF